MLANIKAPENGYAYIYVSNESDEHVYFDNLQVGQVHGRITEENHYYAYGLKIAGISSQKLGDLNEGSLKNCFLYNDKELWEDADLNWYDYGFRNYDPQIGRFPQLDPLTWDYPELTNYQYGSCDPIMNIDLDGLTAPTASERSYQFVAVTSRSVTPAVSLGAKIAAHSLTTLLTFSSIASNTAKVASNIGSAGNPAPVLTKPDMSPRVGLDGISIPKRNPNIQRKPYKPSWLTRASNGSGSTQAGGYTFSGGGGETSEFKDHTDHNYGHVDMGAMFEIGGLFRGEAFPLKATRNVERVLKYVEFHNQVLETTYKISEELKENNPFNKIGNIIYDRSLGIRVKILEDGMIDMIDVPGPAMDTFPKERSYGYLHPLAN